MYLTGDMSQAPSVGDEVLPFLATSKDGIKWKIQTKKPLLKLGKKESDFDHKKMETPSVVYFKKKYHMYYTAVQKNLSGNLSIGHAVSKDGIRWKKTKNSPVIKPTKNISDWNGAQTAEPGAVVYKNKVYLYFVAVGLRAKGKKPIPKHVIGLAISNDAVLFGKAVKVVEQAKLYSASKNYTGYSTPFPIVINKKMHLFYDVAQENKTEKPSSWVQVALHHAVSPDGVKKWIQDKKPIFKRSDLSWTKREIRAPCLLLDRKKLKMWFAGDDLLRQKVWGIGYATIDKKLYTK